jgi:hypothetical protein
MGTLKVLSVKRKNGPEAVLKELGQGTLRD